MLIYNKNKICLFKIAVLRNPIRDQHDEAEELDLHEELCRTFKINQGSDDVPRY
jgi:hypothetical protein